MLFSTVDKENSLKFIVTEEEDSSGADDQGVVYHFAGCCFSLAFALSSSSNV